MLYKVEIDHTLAQLDKRLYRSFSQSLSCPCTCWALGTKNAIPEGAWATTTSRWRLLKDKKTTERKRQPTINFEIQRNLVEVVTGYFHFEHSHSIFEEL